MFVLKENEAFSVITEKYILCSIWNWIYFIKWENRFCFVSTAPFGKLRFKCKGNRNSISRNGISWDFKERMIQK